MSISITSWLGAYSALQAQAMDSRGFVEIAGDTEDAQRWPRTTGADVVAIAALLDPFMKQQPLRFGGQGLAQRWHMCVDDLEAHALDAPGEQYIENRSFWRTLAAVCTYLHAQGAPVPATEIWDALLDELAGVQELRNVGPSGDGPFKHFAGVKTFDDLYIEQFKYLRELRGADQLKPEANMTGPEKPIPRTTNGDVVLLADYWSKQLEGVKRVMGHDGVVANWKVALADVAQLARKADPNALYPNNNAFWRALSQTAVHVAIADEAPSSTDLMLESLKDSVTHLPENLKAAASGAAHLAGDIAQGIGKVANEAGKGLFAGFGTPLLVGAGLLGLFFIARNRHDKAEASS